MPQHHGLALGVGEGVEARLHPSVAPVVEDGLLGTAVAGGRLVGGAEGDAPG